MNPSIHFFTRGNSETASSRYRGYMVAERLEEEGLFETNCLPPRSARPAAMTSISGLAREIRELQEVRNQSREIEQGDILYFQRPINKRLRGLYLLLQSRSNPAVFDFDDAIFLERPNLTRWFLNRADVVIAGNTFLQRYAEWYADTVYKVPTAIPYDQYKEVDPSPNEQSFTVGWAGNIDAHRDNLQRLAEIIESYAPTCPNLEVHLVGTKGDESVEERFRKIDGIETQFVSWIPSEEYTEKIPRIISNFDVGVMPLTDTFWNRGKSAFKLLEYMACGIPVIASPVGENCVVVEEGRNGYLAETIDEWRTALEEIRNASCWDLLSSNARDTIETNYTLDIVSEDISFILSRLS